jgi:hypothetical protein
MSQSIFLRAAMLASCLLLAPPALAEAGARNMAVATRALGFMEPKLAGPTVVAIVYDSGDSASEADAREIARGLAVSAPAGVSFQPQLVPENGLGALGRVRVVFLAAGVSNPATVFAAASKARAVTLSFDLACVRVGRCVIGVRTAPKVEILVSRAARQASGIKFSQAFLMLVTEQ